MIKFKEPFPAIAEEKIHKERIRASRILLKSLVYSFAIFGLLFILLLMAIIGMLKQDSVVVSDIPQKAILSIDLNDVYNEVKEDDLLSDMSGMKSISFYDLLKSVYFAETDKRVKALVADISVTNLGLAQMQELMAALKSFQAHGKKVYVHSTGFGSFGGGLGSYYLATSFDEIYMQPNTDVGITGIGMEVPFFGGVLEKVGVEPEFYTRYEYKSAVVSFTDKEMSKVFRKELERLGGNISDTMLSQISETKKISKKALQEIINRAPIDSEEAVKLGLINGILYKQDLIDKLKIDYKSEVVSVFDYSGNLVNNNSPKLPSFAVLILDGVINSGESMSNPVRGETTLGSKTVVEQIEEIAKLKNVKGVVVRVNSPGGSYGASNEIWYALERLKKNNVPVAVSMGDYAASGGYFIAISGEKIFAEPSTITGSIGVLGGKVVLAELWNKLGVAWGEVKFGENANILSSNHKFSKEESEVFNRSLDNVYKDFTSKVSEARGIDLETLDKFARGRVWTGREAVEIGLVDELGGINDALAFVKEKAGLKVDDKINLVFYPKQKTFQEKVKDFINGGPNASVKVVAQEFGLDIKQLNMLKRMQHDAVLVPFEIRY